MHTCAVLPATKSDGRPCNDSVVPGIPVGLDGLSINGSCINWNQYYTDCRAGEKNPFQGAISFDNIGLAWVAIFLVSTHNFNFFFTFSTLYQYSMRCLCNSNLSNKLLSPIVPSKHIQHLISKTGNSCRRPPPPLYLPRQSINTIITFVLCSFLLVVSPVWFRGTRQSFWRVPLCTAKESLQYRAAYLVKVIV